MRQSEERGNNDKLYTKDIIDIQLDGNSPGLVKL